MVHRTYTGIGRGDAAVGTFDALTPHARKLYWLQAECSFGTPDYAALAVAIRSLETTAYHFTRRRHFYDGLVSEARAAVQPGNNRLADRTEALKEFEALRPYNKALIDLRGRCRPFGPDYMALDIATQGLLTALCHFTGDTDLYAGEWCGPPNG